MKFFIKILTLSYLIFCFNCSHNTEYKANINNYGGTLRINEHSNYISLFPHSTNEIVSYHLISQLYEGLVKYNAFDLTICSAIANSWEIDSTETVYKFFLNTNVYFNDNECFKNGIGRKVTANDFLFSFNLLATQNNNNNNFFGTIDNIIGAKEHYLNKELHIKGIIVENDSTLILKLKKPNPLFLYCLALPAASVIPEEAFKKYSYNSYVGCGPFFIKNLSKNSDSLSLIRNPRYYVKDNKNNYLPYLDTVIFSFNSSSKKELQMLSENKLDLAYNIDNVEVTEFLEKNISFFKGNNPKFILQFSNLNNDIQLQHIIKRNIKGFITNSQNYYDLSKVYYEN